MGIKCACGRKECPGFVWFEEDRLMFTNEVLQSKAEKGSIVPELAIDVDANSLVELIREARKTLIRLSGED